EKHQIPLREEECNHLKNILLLIKNILHIPEHIGIMNQEAIQMIQEWQSLQSKLIWNLFVQGIDGALLLMLNSKYRTSWTIPLALIMALLYRKPASETSEDDEESDGSKNSSASLSSNPSKNTSTYLDSGYPLTSESSCSVKNKRSLRQLKSENSRKEPLVLDIHTKLEKIQISDDSVFNSKMTQTRCKNDHENRTKTSSIDDGNYSETSSSSGTPHHKKMKGSHSSSDITIDKIISSCSKNDSAISMRCSSPEMMSVKSSDDDIFEETIPVKNLKAVQKLRCLQKNTKMSESDSSNEDIQSRIKYPLWEKRNSVSTLVALNSPTPSEEDIGNLLKEFTLSFLHGGFSNLIIDLKNLFLEGPSIAIDKSLLFWIMSYFLQIAANANICVDHISDILNVDIISYLVFECVTACENMELHSQQSERIAQYVSVHLSLLIIALKEILCTIDMYSRKCTSPKDRALFNELSGKLAGLSDLRNLPLLLFQNCPQANALHYLENVIVLNHQILVIIGRGADHCLEPNKINFLTHLKMFATLDIMNKYGTVLENFKSNR
ncbi:protein timeless, partial [Caerostris extrusa]